MDALARGTSRIAIFERMSRSVFRVEAGLAHGTAFLADTLGGVLITNAHVIEGAEIDQITVIVDSVTRVRAQVLARDAESDIAVLRIADEFVADRTRILLQSTSGRAPVVPGERLIALGYPLNQGLTVTSGIASSVRAGAVISDVNINPGNSGGPLLNVHGEAVAVNTFGDVAAQGGPGVSGSVLVAKAAPVLARAAVEVGRSPSPSGDRLPIMPPDNVDVASVKAHADTVSIRTYRRFNDIGVGGFRITVQTPAQTFAIAKAYENDVARDRKKREAFAVLPEAQRYSAVRDVRDWDQYVGSRTAPVVSIAIIPKLGETGGSVFTRLMLGPNLKAAFKFRGDVRGAQLFRDQEFVDPIRGGHAPMEVYVEDGWISLKDVADKGFYIFDIEVFRPDENGVPPSIVLAIRDLKSPKKLKCVELHAEVVAQAWNDFESFYAERRPAAGFRFALARAAKDRKPAYRTDFLEKDCLWYAG